MQNLAHTQKVNVFPRNILTSLLREEIKSRKLASILHDLGVEGRCPWLPSLNDPIAKWLGLKSDAAFQEYDMLMDSFAQQSDTTADVSDLATTLTNRLYKMES